MKVAGAVYINASHLLLHYVTTKLPTITKGIVIARRGGKPCGDKMLNRRYYCEYTKKEGSKTITLFSPLYVTLLEGGF